MSALPELKARIAAAEAGSRELDALIWAALEGFKVTYEGPDEGHSEVWAEGPANTYHLGYRDDGQHTKHFTPVLQVDPVSTSLDAALSLVESKLPGWCPSIGQNVHHKNWLGFVQRVDSEGDIAAHPGTAKTPALALCSALLAALIAGGTHDR